MPYRITFTLINCSRKPEAKEGAFPPCIIEGPLSFDIAFDAHAAAHKGIESKVSGDPDLLVFPNIESGNMLGKSWLQFNQAKWAGIVLGASCGTRVQIGYTRN